jgi:peptidyl-prolyl cis-trans isomerase A (cyclophilin A)
VNQPGTLPAGHKIKAKEMNLPFSKSDGVIIGEYLRILKLLARERKQSNHFKGSFMKKPLVCLLAMIVAMTLMTSLLAAQGTKSAKPRKPGVYAVFDTSMGTFVCELYEKVAPETVANFVGLVEGTKDWRNPRGEVKKGVPYYNGTIFHRVIKDFMIQGGDITGTGTFSPVPKFKDEIVETLKFDKSGLLAMANSGPNTNGSQFFITVRDTPHLNGLHTIFGRVVEGYDVVDKISKVSVDPSNKPLNKVVIEKITIDRVAKAPK